LIREKSEPSKRGIPAAGNDRKLEAVRTGARKDFSLKIFRKEKNPVPKKWK